MLTRRFSAVLIAASLFATGAFAQIEPWGGNVPGWQFSQASESGGVINCRAFQGQNLISVSSNRRTYLSVNRPANLPQGWYREGRASITIGGVTEPVDAHASGRLLFFIDDSLHATLIKARGYQWRVAGPKGLVSGSVSFSGDIAKAIAEARACLRANMAAAKGASAAPRPAGGGIVSLYTRSNGNLCLGAVAGMLNVGILTNCSKRPARIRIDSASKRIRVGDQPNLCLSFALGKFSEFNDLTVADCSRVKMDLTYDAATTQIRGGSFCLGVDGNVQEMTRLKMQPCSPVAIGQKWVLGNTVARP